MVAKSADGQREVARVRDGLPVLEISYFTDPLCCWSWGFEPQLRRLRYAFAGRIAWRLRMGGMVGSWDGYNDPLNDVHRPAQLGPLWIQASTITGMPVEAAVWVQDPPASSWPSCLAVRAAGLQSSAAADLYLRGLREAIMIEGRNIARDDVLLDVAHKLAAARPDIFSAEQFASDLAGRAARAALEDDVREARFRGIGRFPCLGLRRAGAESVWLVGWRPYGEVCEAVRAFAPELGEERRISNPDGYRTYWGGATEREIAVALSPESERFGQGAGPFSSGAGR